MSLKMIKLNIKQALICMVVLSFDLDVSFTKKEKHLFVKTNVFIYLHLEVSLVFF